MGSDIYHIPTNFTNAGKIMGTFEIRNLIEAVIMTIPVLYLCITLIPLAMTPKIIITLALVVPVGGFGLMGIRDDSLSRWFHCWWHWRRSRRMISYRGEVTKK